MSQAKKLVELAYIARKTCGCIVMAIADDSKESPELRRSTAKEVAKAINRGLTVERVEAEYVRQNMKRCKHEAKS